VYKIRRLLLTRYQLSLDKNYWYSVQKQSISTSLMYSIILCYLWLFNWQKKKKKNLFHLVDRSIMFRRNYGLRLPKPLKYPLTHYTTSIKQRTYLYTPFYFYIFFMHIYIYLFPFIFYGVLLFEPYLPYTCHEKFSISR